MRTVKFELDDQAESLFDTLTKTPDFFGDTPRTLFVKLMMRASVQVLPKASAEPEKPIMGKVEKRHQAERDAKAAREKARNDLYRASGVWPSPLGTIDGREVWNFPDGSTGTYTPPDDYPGAITPVDDGGAAYRAWMNAYNAERQAKLEKAAYTPTRPLREEYDTEVEWLAELEMFEMLEMFDADK